MNFFLQLILSCEYVGVSLNDYLQQRFYLIKNADCNIGSNIIFEKQQ